MRPDTRKILATGTITFLAGTLCATLTLTVFGGVTRQGPHTNLGWLSLIAALSCLPLGAITLLLGLAKLLGDRSRS